MALFQLKAAYRMVIKKISYISLFIVALHSCHSKNEQLPFYNTADFTAEWINKNDPAYASIHTIDCFQFTDQSGHLINQDSLAGHVYIANFFFTSCGSICPKMINNLGMVQDSFLTNDAVKLISFSVMPWADSVKRLHEYAETHHIHNNKWHLLTGDKTKIYILGRQSYFSEKKAGLGKDSSEFLHTESILLIDKKSRIRGIYAATDTAQIKRVIADIRILLQE